MRDYIIANRRIPNRASNDFNDEPEFIFQKVKVLGEVKYYNGIEKYIVKDFSNNIFQVLKEEIEF